MSKRSPGGPGPLYKPHPHPAWRDKANFLIMADVQHEGGRPIKEQLWARQIAADRFEVCCIPFFIYGLALGDEVEAGADEEGRYLLRRVVKRSGNRTYWIWFHDSADDAVRLRVKEKVSAFGYLIEWCYSDLLAFNVTADSEPRLIGDALRAEIERGHLDLTASQTG